MTFKKGNFKVHSIGLYFIFDYLIEKKKRCIKYILLDNLHIDLLTFSCRVSSFFIF